MKNDAKKKCLVNPTNSKLRRIVFFYKKQKIFSCANIQLDVNLDTSCNFVATRVLAIAVR